jgi:formate dehydrogenase subunit gamma
MTTATGGLDDRVRRRVNGYGRTEVHPDELIRHTVYTRVLHWGIALFFVLSLLSGFAIYSSWLYYWITPIFGGGPMTRLLHPWLSLVFVLLFAVQILNWHAPMRWRPEDRRWLRRIRGYISNAHRLEPEDVGFFNGGQKVYFWVIVAAAALFLISGIPMWFPHTFGRVAVAVSYVLHDVSALVMLGSFIVHVYEGTAAIPGTFRSMTRGTVEKRWAWTHHPGWYRAATGRDPRQDYERARQRASRSLQVEPPEQQP